MAEYVVIINVPVHDIHATCVAIRVQAVNADAAREKALQQHFGNQKVIGVSCSVVQV